ncbi:MAG: hypothetical protein ACK5CY_08040 [Bacteroidia bacterium]|jgi:hypothetical protein
MRSSFFASILIVLFTNSIKAQEEFSYTGKTSLPKIMSTLFNGQWNGTACVWKPNFYEKSLWGASYDGMLYTMIDTVMIYRTPNATRLILVTSTIKKESATEYEMCHACALGLSIISFDYDKSKGKISLAGFDKFAGFYGAFGSPDEVSLRPFGIEDYFVEINGAFGNMGYMGEYLTFYYLGEMVLSVTTSENNAGNIPEGEEGYFGYVTEVVFDNESKILSLIKKGTKEIYNDDGSSRIAPADEVIRYQFINGRFEKICP